MRSMLRGLVPGLTAIAIGGMSAYAGTLETVTVTGSRAVSEKSVGTSAIGADIREVSLSYKVNAADLDLASSTGKAELEKRVTAAASAACKELDRLAFGDPTSPITRPASRKPWIKRWPRCVDLPLRQERSNRAPALHRGFRIWAGSAFKRCGLRLLSADSHPSRPSATVDSSHLRTRYSFAIRSTRRAPRAPARSSFGRGNSDRGRSARYAAHATLQRSVEATM